MNVLILFLAALFMPGLLYYENKERPAGILPIKITLSLLFIITALIQSHPIPRYFHLILIGLIFCLGGDIFLALPRKRMFTLGLASFLLGHVFYILGFFRVAELNLWTWTGGLIIVFISGRIFFWLRPHLGSMKTPVLLYVLVITLMVIGALSVMGDEGLRLSGRITVISGVVAFYLSDIFVARNRFIRAAFLNRLIGLPLYYLGQFLLAFSVGLLK